MGQLIVRVCFVKKRKEERGKRKKEREERGKRGKRKKREKKEGKSKHDLILSQSMGLKNGWALI